MLACLLATVSFAQIEVAPHVVAPSSSRALVGHVRSNHYFFTGGTASPEAVGPAPKKRTAPDGLYPSRILTAYSLTGGLGSQAIAIVVPFHLPSALKDFNKFSTQFGLPLETSTNPGLATNTHLQVVYATGVPAANVGWGSLAALTMEWAHAIAPKAKVYLVEAGSDSLVNVYTAVKVAKVLPGVKEVIMPWGVDEYAAEKADDAIFVQPGVTFFAPSGDFVGHSQFPATSPNVIGVGGTHLIFSGTTAVETAWDSSACGLSPYEPRPAGQDPVNSVVGAKRGSPDITAIGDPLTSVAVYSDFAIGGWSVMGGTSLSSAIAGALANARGSFSDSSATELFRINTLLGTRFFRDITAGSTGTFSAKAGYDILTGAGSGRGLFESVIAKVYKPTVVSIDTGVHTAGTLASLAALDANSLQVLAKNSSGLNWAQITVKIPIDHVPSQMVNLSLQVSALTALRADISVIATDFKTGNTDTLATIPGSASMTSTSIPISKWATVFAPAAGNYVQITLQATRPATSGPFTLSLDQVTLTGSY